MSAIESSLRLEIAQYQAALSKAKADAAKFKEDLKRNSQDMGEAVLGKPEAWHSVRANMTAFKLQMGREGEEAGGMMGMAMRSGMMRFAGPAALVAVVGGGIKSAVQAAGADEMMNIRMNVIVGDTSKAQELIGSLKALGARTPLEFTDLAEAGSMLVAFGEDAARVPAVLTRLGDVAQGVGAPLRDIAEIYGKARVQNQLFAEDINQLTGRGIPVIQEFARILQRPESEIKKMASEGRITFPLLEAAFKNLTKEGGKFAGMMEAISKSSEGKWSTFKDEVSQTSALFGRPLAKTWGEGLDWVTSKMSGVKNMLRSLNETATEGVARLRAEEAARTAKNDAPDDAAIEAKLRADALASENAAKEEAARKVARKADEEREKQARAIADLRKDAERMSISMLPDDKRLAALKVQMQSLMQDAQFRSLGSGQRLNVADGVEGLNKLAAAHGKAGNKTGEMAVLKQYKEALAVQKEIDSLQKSLDEKKSADTKKSEEDKRRVAQTRAVLELETKIAKEQAKSGKDDNKAITAFRDELNVLQLSAQIQEQLKTTQAEALKIAQEKVGAERAAAIAIKAQATAEKSKQQLRSRQELAAEMKVDSLRAAGKDKEADALERRIRLVREAQRIQQETGLSERQSAAIARQRIADQEKAEARAARAAGLASGDMPRRKITRGTRGDQDPDGRYGLAGRPGGTMTKFSGPLSQGGPLSKNGGIDGFNRLQSGEAGELGRLMGPSARHLGMGLAPSNKTPAPMDAQHAQNAAGDTASRSDPNGSHNTRVEQLLRDLNETLKTLAD